MEHTVRRQNVEYRESERQRDAAANVTRRRDLEIRLQEQELNIVEHSMRRQNEEYRAFERIRDASAHVARRLNVNVREQEANTV